jgi:hypothetical protein
MTDYVEPYQITDETTVGTAQTINMTDVFGEAKRLVSVTFNWTAGVAPTTAENIVVTLDSCKGAAYDVPLRIVDPSTFGGGFYDWIWNPNDTLGDRLILSKDDHISVTYANTDDLAIGVVLTMEAV